METRAVKHTAEVLEDMHWAVQLRDLARRVDRLRPDWNDQERFHAERDEIAEELNRISREAHK